MKNKSQTEIENQKENAKPLELSDGLSEVKAVVNAYYDMQDVRIRTENRLRSIRQKRTPEEIEANTETSSLEKQMQITEKEAFNWLAKKCTYFPIYNNFLSHVRGIGPTISAGLISSIQDIKRFETKSKLWAYAGLRPRTYCLSCKKLILDSRDKEQFKKSVQNWLDHLERMKQTKQSHGTDEIHDNDAFEVESQIQYENHFRHANLESHKGLENQSTHAKLFEIIKKAVCSCEHPLPIVHAEKRTKGIPSFNNTFLKTLCWKIGESFVKIPGYYRTRYDEFKEEETQKAIYSMKTIKSLRNESQSNHENQGSNANLENQKPPAKLSKGLIHNRAKRKTVKLFLAHLWEAWAVQEGMPIPKPYPFVHQEGHKDFYNWKDALEK